MYTVKEMGIIWDNLVGVGVQIILYVRIVQRNCMGIDVRIILLKYSVNAAVETLFGVERDVDIHG